MQGERRGGREGQQARKPAPPAHAAAPATRPQVKLSIEVEVREREELGEAAALLPPAAAPAAARCLRPVPAVRAASARARQAGSSCSRPCCTLCTLQAKLSDDGKSVEVRARRVWPSRRRRQLGQLRGLMRQLCWLPSRLTGSR